MSVITVNSQFIEVTMENNGIVIHLSNGASNVWNKEMLLDLKALMLEISDRKDLRYLVITGKGEKFFSAGADLKLFASSTPEEGNLLSKYFQEAFLALRNFPGISIAAINGYAMGGGLECALSCDIRLASPNAILALPEATVGLLPGGCGTQLLPRVVGETWAKRMILLGERLSAETALSIGLIHSISTDIDQLLVDAITLAKQVLKQSPEATKASKALIHLSQETSLEEGLAIENEKFSELFFKPNLKEGLTAFLEKRSANWK